MIILDSNGLIYCLANGKLIHGNDLVVTEDLREEYDTALLINGRQSLNLIDAESLPGYEEAYYYREYTAYLNSFPGANVASMRSLTDVSILALVSCVINCFGHGRQIQLDFDDQYQKQLTIVTDDNDLSRRLIADFGDDVEVIDPLTL